MAKKDKEIVKPIVVVPTKPKPIFYHKVDEATRLDLKKKLGEGKIVLRGPNLEVIYR